MQYHNISLSFFFCFLSLIALIFRRILDSTGIKNRVVILRSRIAGREQVLLQVCTMLQVHVRFIYGYAYVYARTHIPYVHIIHECTHGAIREL